MRAKPTDRHGIAMRSSCIALLVAALMVSQFAYAQSDSESISADIRSKADEIRASANQLTKMRRIPWVTDPAEGFRLAKEENRPVFFYAQTGDPLDDC